MDQGSGDIAEAVNRLVDDYRLRCLWYVREDYYPTTDEERRHVLDAIERHGDVAAHRRVGEIRRWLSRTSRPNCAGRLGADDVTQRAHAR